MIDVLEEFSWHSSIGIDCSLDNKRFVSRLPNSKKFASLFTASGNKLLIHKTTRCLWKTSDDGKFIEPVFGNDILTEEDVKEAMREI